MSKLIIITSNGRNDLVEAESKLSTTNKPFTRHSLIMNKLSEVYPYSSIIIPVHSLEYIEDMLRPFNIINNKYLDFLKNAFKSCGSIKYHSMKDSELKSPYDCGLVNYLFTKDKNVDPDKLPYFLQCGIYGSA